MKWTEETEAGITFDFGDPPRLCDDQQSEIRISFHSARNPGYWSAVGTDSVLMLDQSQASLNLEGFDREGVPDEEFQGVVLHEFGHALGFNHEHQSPFGYCESEYNWDAVYKDLGGPPNCWTKDQIDWNMKALQERDLEGTEFDPASIMVYDFPEYVFKQGRLSPCYVGRNSRLSKTDRELLRRVYPSRSSSPKGK